MTTRPPNGEMPTCGLLNDGQQGEVVRAGVAALRTLVIDGALPPVSPLLEVDGGAIARDDDGIALGGIRTPAVDAAVARLTGENESEGGIICGLFGTTEPWDVAELVGRYATVDDYVAAVTASADAAVEAGFMLPADSDQLVAAAPLDLPRVAPYTD